MLPKLFRQTIINKLSEEEPLKNQKKIQKLKMLKDYLCDQPDLLSFKKMMNKRYHSQHSIEQCEIKQDQRRSYTIDNASSSKKDQINKPQLRRINTVDTKQQRQNAKSSIFDKKKRKKLSQLFELRNSNKLTKEISVYRNNLSQKLALYKLR